MENKFKRILSCFFGGRGKVQCGRKKQAIKFRRKVQICLVGSVRTRLAHRLSSQLFPTVSTPNIVELVLFGFFCPKPWFLRRSEHQLFHVDSQLVTKKEISIKINFHMENNRSEPSALISGF